MPQPSRYDSPMCRASITAFALAAAAACGAPAAAPPADTARRPPPPASQPADPLRDALNLDFEDGDPPTGWRFNGEGYTLSVDAAQHHAGARSARITHAGGKHFAVLMRSLPLDAALGKRVVVTGW